MENESENERLYLKQVINDFPDPADFVIGFICHSSLDQRRVANASSIGVHYSSYRTGSPLNEKRPNTTECHSVLGRNSMMPSHCHVSIDDTKRKSNAMNISIEESMMFSSPPPGQQPKSAVKASTTWQPKDLKNMICNGDKPETFNIISPGAESFKDTRSRPSVGPNEAVNLFSPTEKLTNNWVNEAIDSSVDYRKSTTQDARAHYYSASTNKHCSTEKSDTKKKYSSRAATSKFSTSTHLKKFSYSTTANNGRSSDPSRAEVDVKKM